MLVKNQNQNQNINSQVNKLQVQWLHIVKTIALSVFFANSLLGANVASAACTGVDLQVGYDFNYGAKTGTTAPDAGVCVAGATTAPAGDDYCTSNTGTGAPGPLVPGDYVIRTADTGVATLKYLFDVGTVQNNYTIVVTIPRTGEVGVTSGRAPGQDVATWVSVSSACGTGSGISNGGRTLTCNLGTVDATGGAITVGVPGTFLVSASARNGETFALQYTDSSSGGSAGACLAAAPVASQALTVSARPKIDIKTNFYTSSDTTYFGVAGRFISYFISVDGANSPKTVGGEAVAAPLTFNIGLKSNVPTAGTQFVDISNYSTDTSDLTTTIPVNAVVGNNFIIPVTLTPKVSAPNCAAAFLVPGGGCTSYAGAGAPNNMTTQVIRYFVPHTDFDNNSVTQIDFTNYINSDASTSAQPITTPSASGVGGPFVEPINLNSAPYTLLRSAPVYNNSYAQKYTEQYAYPNGTLPTGNYGFVSMPGEGSFGWCAGGSCKQYPGQSVQSTLNLYNGSGTQWNNTILCDKFDNRGQVLVARARNAGVAANNFPSNVSGDTVVGMYNGYDGAYWLNALPNGYTVEVATAPGTPVGGGYPSNAQQCGDADAAWVNPQGIADLSLYNLVRVKASVLVAGYPFIPTFNFIVPAAAPVGEYIGNQMMLRTDTQGLNGGTAGNWSTATYDPITNSGVYSAGERFQVIKALVRVKKEAYHPTTGDAVAVVGAGKSVTYKLLPTFTAEPGVSAPDSTISVVDTLPADASYKLGSAHICVGGTPTGGLCTGGVSQPIEPNSIVVNGSGQLVLTWSLPNVVLNSVIPPIYFDVDLPSTIPTGSPITNVVTVASPLIDQSTDAERSASVTLTVDNVAGFFVNKQVNLPIIARNGSYSNTLNIANLRNTAEANVDVIDVLPRVGDPRTPSSTFSGTSFLTGPATAISGAAGLVVYYTKAAVGMAPTVKSSTLGGVSAAVVGSDFLIAATAANGWCLPSEFNTGICPANYAEVTGLRAQLATIAGLGVAKINVPMGTSGNVNGDVYTNRFAMRSTLAAPLFSNDVTTAVRQASLAGKVYVDANLDGIANAGEVGLANVPITLCDVATPIPCPAGNIVAVTNTFADGTYQFNDLLPGTYYVRETQPAGYTSAGANSAGSAGGTALSPDAFDGVTLVTGQAATNYNFGERTIANVFLPANPDGSTSCSAGTHTVLRGLATGNLSIVNGGGFLRRAAPDNIVLNGSFENATLTPYGHIVDSAAHVPAIANWIYSGGGQQSYPQVFGATSPLNAGNPIVNMEGGKAFYFGNDFLASVPGLPAAPTAQGYWNVPGNQVFNTTNTFSFGDTANPVSINQTIPTVVGKTYRISFVNGYEAGNANEYTQPGIYGVKIGDYDYVYPADGVGQPSTRFLEFVATSATTNIKFSNWGHLSNTATELVIDDVIINECAPNVFGNVFNDTNGLADTLVNGTGTEAVTGGTLTAYIVDNTGNIVGVSDVAADGKFAFKVPPATGYRVILSNTPNSPATAWGQPLAASSLPAGWVSTGEHNDVIPGPTTGSDGTIDGISDYFDVVSGADVVERNFGITNENKIDVVKAAGIAVQTGPSAYDIAYEVIVGNQGAKTVYNVQTNDNLVATYPAPATITSVTNYSATAIGVGTTCTGNAAFNGDSDTKLLAATDDLATGQACSIKFTVHVNYGANPVPARVYNNALASGMADNAAVNAGYTAITQDVNGVPTGTPPAGASTTDISTDGNVTPTTATPVTPVLPVTSGADTPLPTPTTFAANKIDVVKAVGTPKQTGAKTFEIDYAVVVGNVGATSPTVYNVQSNDNLKRTFPTATSIVVSNYVVAGNPAAGSTCAAATPAYAGTAAASNMLSGTTDLASDQSCIITFKVTVDFGVNPIPAPAQNNTVYASGVGDNATANPGYTVPDVGAPTAPAVATATDISVDNVAARPPVGSLPGTAPTIPALPATPNVDAPAGVVTPVLLAPQLTLSGNVFDDFNGTKIQDNPAESAVSKPIPVGLNAVLTDAAGIVIAVVPVAADGTYSFPASPLTTYGVVITTANPAVGANAVPVTLPANWATTGENLGGTVEGLPATSDSKQTVTTALVSLANVNFGIEQLPNTNNATAPIQANPGGATQVTVPTLVGNDPEDGPDGSITQFVIKTLPVLPDGTTSAGVLYYNGVPVTAGQVIVGYDPTKLTFDPINGAITATFTVASVDAAGKEDPTPATVTMQFTQLSLMGNVFNDANGLGDNLVNGTGTNAGSSTLTAYLVDSTGKVLDYALVDSATGTYTIPVSPGTGYTVVLSNTAGTPASVGIAPPAASLPANYVNTGENNAAATVAGSDGTVNGISATFDVGATDVTNVNFGIAQTASLSGIVWRDNNHDRAFTAGETTLAGFLVEVVNAAGTVVKTDTTKADGSYNVIGLTPGVPYSVRFRDPATNNIILGVPTYNDATANTAVGGTNGGSPQGTSTIDPTGGKLNVVLVAGQNLSNQSLPLDPNGVVYDSVQRTPIQGAVVTFLANGNPVPNQCLVGGLNSITTGPLGYYEFLLVNGAPAGCPGVGGGEVTYTVSVTPPTGGAYLPPNATLGGVVLPSGTLTAPANGTNNVVQSQAGVPTGTQETTYYFAFNVTLSGLLGTSSGHIVNNHIPLDPAGTSALFVNKTGNKSIAEIGDVVMYTVTAKLSTGSQPSAQLVDNLPAGFRYIPGTATIAKPSVDAGKVKALADPLPVGNKGPQLTFLMGAISSAETVTVTYKVRVGVGAMQGDGINRVHGQAPGVTSNTAQYKVKVTGGVFTNEACVAGKVFVDCNNNHIQDDEELGIPGVRMYMEDGTYFITDVEGKYSYCGISPKTHVLKVDSLTMPRGSRMTTTSNRNAGDGNSLFLDTKNGELIRADFAEGSCSNTVLEQVKARRTQGEVRAPETEKKSGPAIKFEGKSPNYPQQGTDSANQRLVKPRGGAGDAPVSHTVNDNPVQPIPESSGNTRGNNLRDQKGGAK